LSQHRQLWLLAGGNGAGKSTFYRTQLEPLGLPFINADILAKELYPESPEEHSYVAAQLAAEKRSELLIEGRSFCFETVFSHPSKIDFLAQAKTLGYEIILIMIHLDSDSLNKARVSQRISEGGHSVPDKKIEDRIPRLLVHIKKALPLCDHVRILNNSRADDPFKQIATISDGQLDSQLENLPGWATELLSEYL
jgi:predicted ABC-type ATPase